MDAELRCPVCHEYFEDPIMLQCAHHICAAHVAGLAGSNGRGCRTLTCVACGDITAVPDGGLHIDRTLQLVVNMRDSIQAETDGGNDVTVGPDDIVQLCGFCEEQPATRQCVQCDGVLCQACEKTSHSKGFFKNHTVVDLNVAGAACRRGSAKNSCTDRMLCYAHPEEKLSFYCLDCREPVCSHCLILGDHKGHQQSPLDKAYATGRDTLGAWCGELKRRVGNCEKLTEQLQLAEQEVDKGAEAQRAAINREMDHLRELVETKRQQLLSKSTLEEKPKRQQLQAQLERAEVARQEANELVFRTQELLMVSNEHAFLSLMLPLVQDMKKCNDQQLDEGPRVSKHFRPLSTDAQVRCLGDLDLGHTTRSPAVGVTTAQGTTYVQPHTHQQHTSYITTMGSSTQQAAHATATVSYLQATPTTAASTYQATTTVTGTLRSVART